MNYSRYSIQELQESLSSIDKHKYPERYQELLKEFSSRKEEVEQYRKHEKEKITVTVNNRLKILAWVQIITCLGFIFAGFTSLLQQFTLFNFALFLGTSTLNGLAGYFLLRRKQLGFQLSYFNQVAQLFWFNFGSIYYAYSGLIYLVIVIQNGIDIKASLLSPSFQFLLGNNLGFGVGIDLVPLFFIWLLSSCHPEKDI